MVGVSYWERIVNVSMAGCPHLERLGLHKHLQRHLMETCFQCAWTGCAHGIVVLGENNFVHSKRVTEPRTFVFNLGWEGNPDGGICHCWERRRALHPHLHNGFQLLVKTLIHGKPGQASGHEKLLRRPSWLHALDLWVFLRAGGVVVSLWLWAQGGNSSWYELAHSWKQK